MNDSFEILFGLVALAIVAAIAFAISSIQCSSRWDKSGMETSWGPIQGCLVKTQGGRWVPDDRVRETDIAPAKP